MQNITGGADLAIQTKTLSFFRPQYIALLLVICVYTFLCVRAFSFTIDDTYIFFRYARNFVESGALVWNIGEAPPTEGYTSLLWTLLCSIVFSFYDVHDGWQIKVMGGVFGAASIAILYLLTLRLGMNKGLAIVPPLVLAMSGPFVLWSISGMETSLYTFLVLLGFYLVAGEEQSRQLQIATPIVFFLILLTRTEGIVFIAAVVAVRTFRWLRFGDNLYSPLNGKYLTWLAAFAIPLGAYVCWKLIYYGDVVPLPAYVKKPAGLNGVVYVKNFLLGYAAPLVLIALIGLRQSLRAPVIYMWAALFIFLLAIGFANPLMGQHSRLVLVAIPILCILSVFGIQKAIDTETSKVRSLHVFAVVMFLTLALEGTPWTHYQELEDHGKNAESVLRNVYFPLGEWLETQRLEQNDTIVALADAGATAFLFKGEVIDFFGLNDIRIAKAGFAVTDLLARKPTYIILKSGTDTSFSGTPTEYGKLSDDIFSNADFQMRYRHREQFTNDDPFYSLWVYEQVNRGN